MNNSTIVFLINDDIRAIKANYEDGHSPEVFKTFDTSVRVDDLLVVESGTRHEMTVVKVTDVDVEIDLDTTSKIKWVVQKIDKRAFAEVLAQEGEAIATVQSAERARKRDELRASIFKNAEDKIGTLKLANHTADEEVTE